METLTGTGLADQAVSFFEFASTGEWVLQIHVANVEPGLVAQVVGRITP